MLPILRHKRQILFALEKYNTLVIIGETGSGKTTQVAQYLHEANWTADGYMIACTQSRRLAAIAVANRVAEERGIIVGQEVGYSVRFDSRVSTNTKIKFCTDGILVRETLSDPLLSKYSVLIIDEAHERTLNTDILLGLLKKILKKRKELRVIIMSATIDAMSIKNFFEFNSESKNHPENDTAAVLTIQGRTFPVDIFYLENPCKNFINASVETVLNIHKNEPIPGDILVFLPGSEDIDIAAERLKDLYDGDDLIVLTLYSALPFDFQQNIFKSTPHGKRKVILSTNLAETSVTINGIKHIVDSGYLKLNYFDVFTGVDTLITRSISKASARQRAGRAGRTQAGKCYRLMTEDSFNNLPEFLPPEMQRCDISWMLLQIKALGIDDVVHFDFLSPPPAESMIIGLELLYSLGAINLQGKLTELGEKMAEMPTEPKLSKILLNSFEFGCTDDILTIAAMISIDPPYITMRAGANKDAKKKQLDSLYEMSSKEGDLLTYLNIYKEFAASGFSRSWCDSMYLQNKLMAKAKDIRDHLHKLLKSLKPDGFVFASCMDDHKTLVKCIMSGYFANAAQLKANGKYYTIRGNKEVDVHSSSVISKFGISPDWVIFIDLIHTKSAQIRNITKINPTWLLEIAPHYYNAI